MDPHCFAGNTPSRAIHDSARPNGVGCWVGQMIETGLALTCGLAVASLDNCIYHNDLIPTQYYLADDIIIPTMKLNPDSTVDVPDTPGMGVSIDEKKLERYTVARDIIRV